MSTTADLIAALEAELKAARITCADLVPPLGGAASSVKRMFAKGDMPLTRVDEVLRVLTMDFAEIARRVADGQPARRELTLEQERAVVADRMLLRVATGCLSQWTYEQIVSTYKAGEADAVKPLTRLDRLGVIALKPMNRYRIKVAKTFRRRPDGPVMHDFRHDVVGDSLSGRFDGEGEMLMRVHGQIGCSLAALFNERLTRVAQDFAQQHLADQRLPPEQKRRYTLLIGMRSWWIAALRDLRRAPGQ